MVTRSRSVISHRHDIGSSNQHAYDTYHRVEYSELDAVVGQSA